MSVVTGITAGGVRLSVAGAWLGGGMCVVSRRRRRRVVVVSVGG